MHQLKVDPEAEPADAEAPSKHMLPHRKSLVRMPTFANRIINANKETTFMSTLLILGAMLMAGLSAITVIYTRPTKVGSNRDVTGGTSLLPMLEEHFEKIFEKRTRTWNPIEGLKVKADNVDVEALNQLSPQLAVAVGLAAAS